MLGISQGSKTHGIYTNRSSIMQEYSWRMHAAQVRRYRRKFAQERTLTDISQWITTGIFNTVYFYVRMANACGLKISLKDFGQDATSLCILVGDCTEAREQHNVLLGNNFMGCFSATKEYFFSPDKSVNFPVDIHGITFVIHSSSCQDIA